jgi:hypothetical protein
MTADLLPSVMTSPPVGNRLSLKLKPGLKGPEHSKESIYRVRVVGGALVLLRSISMLLIVQ